MPTTKKRINISLSKKIEVELERLAKRDQVPQATKAVQLLQLALELEEDQIWDTIASKRDRKGARFVPHEQAWA